MKRLRHFEENISSKLSHLLHLLSNISDEDQVTPTLTTSLKSLLDTESTMTELLTTDVAYKSIAFVSNAALGALLCTWFADINGQKRQFFNGLSSKATNSNAHQIIELSPNTSTRTCSYNNLSLLNFVQKVFALRYNLHHDIIQNDVFELWQRIVSRKEIPMPSGERLHMSSKNQEWIPRFAYMLAYSYLMNRVKRYKGIRMETSSSKQDQNGPKNLFYQLKHDFRIQTALRVLSFSTCIAWQMDDQKRVQNHNASVSPVLAAFEPIHTHVDNFVNALMNLSTESAIPSVESPSFNERTKPAENTFQSLLDEVQACHDLEDDIELRMVQDSSISELEQNMIFDSSIRESDENLESPTRDEDEKVHPQSAKQSEYEKDAAELLPILDQMSTTTREISSTVSKLVDILHRASTIDGAGGIVRVAKLLQHGDNPRQYSDEMLSSLCKACITEEISAVRASAIISSFVLPSIQNIGKDDPSRPPSRVLMSTISSLINSRQTETISNVIIKILCPRQNDRTHEEILKPNNLQIEFFTRIMKSVQLSSENALTLLTALNSIFWTEPSMVLFTTILQKMPNKLLSDEVQSTLIDKIIILSVDNLYVKSTKFASLIQIFVKRYGSSLESVQVNRLQEACANLKSITGKAVVTSLRKLA